MPNKLPALRLTSLKPTDQEIADAKAILDKASEKDRKSRMSSMVSFLKANPDPQATSSRGEVRQEFLMKFMVHQLRSKDAAKRITTGHTVSRTEAAGCLFTWMSKETMDKKPGEFKAKHWRESGKLKVHSR